jgi:hypothetical protein
MLIDICSTCPTFCRQICMMSWTVVTDHWAPISILSYLNQSREQTINENITCLITSLFASFSSAVWPITNLLAISSTVPKLGPLVCTIQVHTTSSSTCPRSVLHITGSPSYTKNWSRTLNVCWNSLSYRLRVRDQTSNPSQSAVLLFTENRNLSWMSSVRHANYHSWYNKLYPAKSWSPLRAQPKHLQMTIMFLKLIPSDWKKSLVQIARS